MVNSEKNYDNMLSRFHLIPERYGQTEGQTDGHNCYINLIKSNLLVDIKINKK